MWKRHWGLSRDPFLDGPAHYVPLAGHQEARARLAYTIESSQRLAVLSAAAGLGKTMVLRQALAESRSAGRRIALSTNPLDGLALWDEFADRLGAAPAASRDRATIWRRLERATTVCKLQGQQVVLAVDGGETLVDETSQRDVERLTHLGGANGPALTVLFVLRDDGPPQASRLPWTLSIGLSPMTRGEAERYIAEKLMAAGCADTLFTARAIVRLHAASSGVPRGLDRLASLSLLAAASRGLEAVSSEVVDGAAQECHVPWA